VASLVGKGDVNQVFIVRAGDTQVAVRLNDDETAWQDYAKEQWCIEQAAAKGVPGPKFLRSGKAGQRRTCFRPSLLETTAKTVK